MTMHAKRYQNSAAFLIIMRCTNTFEPVESAEPLSQIIKGQQGLLQFRCIQAENVRWTLI